MAGRGEGRMDRLLTVAQVAELLGTTERFPRRLIAERRIRFVRVAVMFVSRSRRCASSWRRARLSLSRSGGGPGRWWRKWLGSAAGSATCASCRLAGIRHRLSGHLGCGRRRLARSRPKQMLTGGWQRPRRISRGARGWRRTWAGRLSATMPGGGCGIIRRWGRGIGRPASGICGCTWLRWPMCRCGR